MRRLCDQAISAGRSDKAEAEEMSSFKSPIRRRLKRFAEKRGPGREAVLVRYHNKGGSNVERLVWMKFMSSERS